jgi:hypothetical protein
MGTQTIIEKPLDVRYTLTAAAKDASSEEIFAELARMTEAIAAGHSRPLVFGDLHWKDAAPA